MVFTFFNISFMSVSSSQGLISRQTEVLAMTAFLVDFFGVICLEPFFCTFFLLLIVFTLRIAAKEINIIIVVVIVSCGGSLSWGRSGGSGGGTCRFGLFKGRYTIFKLENHSLQVVCNFFEVFVFELK